MRKDQKASARQRAEAIYEERNMKKEHAFQLRQSLILLLTAVIWGAAFVAQSVGMDYIGPFTFTAIRFVLGALVLVPVILLGKYGRGEHGGREARRPAGGAVLIRGGILCGTALGFASILQQLGILYTTVGKAGFITALYIVLVPIFGIAAGRRNSLLIWVCVAVAAAGLYFLCMKEGISSLQKGDMLCIACAGVFALQILLIDHYAGMVDGVMLSEIQFLTAAVIGAVLMVLFERPSWEAVMAAKLPLLYTGVMSSGVAYTLQIIGQRGLNPTIASLIMSLESPVSVLAGFIFLHQAMTGRELTGCALMAAAIVLAQLKPESSRG